MLKKLDFEIDVLAEKIAIKKLNEQGIDYRDLSSTDFNDLVNTRKKILQKDVKNVGVAAAVTLGLTILTGGI